MELNSEEKNLVGAHRTDRHVIKMQRVKHIALVAHDNRKQALLEWAKFNRDSLSKHVLYGTGTTGSILMKELDLKINLFKSGPLGGDQQVGAKISEGEIDFLIFFWDPLAAQPHDPDVKALLRIATLYNIAIAVDRASADFMISSPLMDQAYERILPEYQRFGS